MSKDKEIGIDKIYSNYETIQAKIAYNWLSDSNDCILEVGCSSGYFTNKLLNKAKKVCGLDVNEEHIDIAKKKYPHIAFKAVDADTLPYDDVSFDVVIMLEVYEHVSNREKTINEVYRVLKPKGTLILTTPNKGMFAFLDSFNLKVQFKRILPVITRFLEQKVQRYKNTQYTDNIQWHPHFSLSDVENSLSKQFTIEKVHRGGLFLFPLFAIFRSVLVRTIPIKFVFDFFIGVMNLDGAIRYGAAAYNLAIFAKKV